jgi:hypothetical protein
MSFRIVAGKIIVFSLVGWCSRSKHMLRISLAYAVLMLVGIIPYCYAFTNLNTRLGYFQMFQMIFKQIANTGHILVYWSYLYNTLNGIKTIGLNMCKKQVGGKYMSGIC